MKFLHLGDLHLGKSLGEFDLIADQKYILDQILAIIDQEAVDAVLIAGDVYDKAVPSEAATGLLDFLLSQFASKSIKTFMISGNHDSDDRLNYGSALFAHEQIYISSIFSGKLTPHILKDGEEEIAIYLLPFVKASQVRHFFPEADIKTYEDAVRVILDHTEIDTKKTNLLVAHQFVAGAGGDPILAGSEGAGAQSVGLVERIGYRCFNAFDYVALGHIHSPQRVGRDTVRYCGSPLKYSLSEVENEKSVPIITIDGKHEMEIRLVPLKPMRDLRHIKGTLKELLRSDRVRSPEDFMYVTLTDEEIINDAMGIVQQTYPNTVKLDYDNAYTREWVQMDGVTTAKNRSFSEWIGDFYKLIYGCEMSEEERAVMQEVAREAGVSDETDEADHERIRSLCGHDAGN